MSLQNFCDDWWNIPSQSGYIKRTRFFRHCRALSKCDWMLLNVGHVEGHVEARLQNVPEYHVTVWFPGLQSSANYLPKMKLQTLFTWSISILCSHINTICKFKKTVNHFELHRLLEWIRNIIRHKNLFNSE
jgi:hypothetical protein